MTTIKDLHRQRAEYVEQHKKAELAYRQRGLSADDETMLIATIAIARIDRQLAELIKKEKAL